MNKINIDSSPSIINAIDTIDIEKAAGFHNQ